MKNLPLKFTAFSVTVIMFLAASMISGRRAGQLEAKEIATQAEVVYTLGDYNGFLAIYQSNESEPIEVYDIFTESLPPEEYLRVTTGISANSEEALQALIEAYSS